MAAPARRPFLPSRSQERATPAGEARNRGWIVRSPGAALACLALAVVGATGCASADGAEAPDEVLVQPELGLDPSIYGGVEDDEGAHSGVVALRVGTGGTFELCTGALVAPNVVLTARHCVTKNTTTSVSCDEDGRSANGKHVASDEDPRTIGVYTGVAPSFAKKPLALAKTIIAPQGGYLCDSDIALLVLDRDVPDAEPFAVRLDAPARPGETIRAVGYGQNDAGVPIGRRFRKSGVEVLAQGKGISASRTPLGAHEFEVGKSICQGDSGGPAISEETGAVIGVVSRGGGCNDDFGHIYTTTAGFDALLREAFALAGGAPLLETGAPGASTRSRTTTSAPAQADEEATEGGGCSTSPRGARGGAGVGLALAAALVLRARRRRA